MTEQTSGLAAARLAHLRATIEADIDANRALFDTYSAEAERMLGERLPVPAYSYVLKCSHAFNLLDARGVISVTERQSYILRIRDLAKACGEAWLHTGGGGAEIS